jgi:hypothetical protein
MSPLTYFSLWLIIISLKTFERSTVERTDRRVNKRIMNVCSNYVDEYQTSSQPFRNWVILINALCSSPCDAFDFQQSNSTLIKQTSQNFTSLCSPNFWLEISVYPQCPATDCSSQLFMVWLVFSHWDGSQVPRCYDVFHMRPSQFEFVRIKALAMEATRLSFQIIHQIVVQK